MALFKSTIIIWTDYNPVCTELEDLVRDAMSGDGYLQEQSYEIVDNQDAPNEVKAFMFADEESGEN